MTALSELLAERPSDGSGVYRLPPDTPADVVEQVAAGAGWRLVVADTAGRDDKRGVLTGFQEAFGFAAWFGKNLDALVDALREVADEPGTVLFWSGGDVFEENDGDQYRRILAVLRDRARADTPARFLTLLGGPGAAPQVY